MMRGLILSKINTFDISGRFGLAEQQVHITKAIEKSELLTKFNLRSADASGAYKELRRSRILSERVARRSMTVMQSQNISIQKATISSKKSMEII